MILSQTFIRIIYIIIVCCCGISTNAQQRQLDSLLIEAIKANDEQKVISLLFKGANINAVDSNLATPLMWAATKSNLKLFKILIKNGANCNKKGVIYINSTKTAYYGNLLGIAAAKNDTLLLNYCLDSLKLSPNDKEYNPETKNEDGWAPLHWAGFNGRIESAVTLMFADANFLMTDKNNKTPYLLAFNNGEYGAALLIQKWAGGYTKNGILSLLDSIKQANMLYDMGDSCEEKNNYPCALEYRKRELLYSKLIYGEKHPDYATSLNNLAGLYESMGSYQKALPYYQQALQIRKEILGEKHSDYASSLNNFGYLYNSMGSYQKALPYYQQALQIRKEILGEKHPDYASSLNNLALLYVSIGSYQKALPYYQQALQIRKEILGEKHPDYATSLNNLALLYESMGSYQKALPYYQQALQIEKEILGEKHPNYASSLNNLAGLYESMGSYQKALPYYQQALQIRKEILGEKHPNYATSLNNLASLYESMGSYQKALPYYQQSLQIDKEVLGENHPSYATSLNNLAGLYKSMGSYQKALPYYQQALQIRKEVLGEKHPDYSNSLNNLAVLYESMGSYQKALPYYQQSLQTIKETLGEKHPHYATSLLNMALLVYKIDKNDPRVSDLLSKGIEITTNFLKTGTSFLGDQALQNFIKKNYYNFEQVNSIAISLHSKELVQKAFAGELLLKGIALQNSRDLAAILQNSKDTSTVALIENFTSIRNRLTQLSQQNTAFKAIDSLTTIYENLEQQLMQQSPAFQQLIKNRNINWQQVQQKLQPNEAAIEFVHFRYWDNRWTDTTQYAAFLLLPKGEPQMIGLCTKKMLKKRINDSTSKDVAYVNELYQVKDRGIIVAKKKDTAASLYQLLWQPLDSLLTGISTVYYAPSGLLHRINLAAINYADRKVLGDKYKFHLLGSTRDIVNYQSPLADSKKDSMLAYGGIRFDMDSAALAFGHKKYFSASEPVVELASRSGEGYYWSELPASAEEIDSVQAMATAAGMDCLALTATDATEESFKYYTSQTSSPSFIHVATHGFFIPDEQRAKQLRAQEGSTPYFIGSPNVLFRSGIAFAGANQVSSGKPAVQGIEDGIVTGYDITNANLQNTKLMVLSACETGLGKIENTEGVFGLQRAIRMAGCKNLLMSLWKVPDEQTNMFMQFFYRALLQQKQTVYDAYTNAQQQMKKLFKDQPYFWAGFVLME